MNPGTPVVHRQKLRYCESPPTRIEGKEERKKQKKTGRKWSLSPALNSPPTETVREDFLEEAAFEVDLAEKGFSLVQEEKTQAGAETVPETPGEGSVENLVLFPRIDGTWCSEGAV